MPKTKISEFSATPANNTDIDSINIAEGCAPSGINDAIRELMSQLKDFQTGAVGDSFNGPVGSTTAAAGAFTTLSATGNVTLGDASTDTLNVGNGGLIKDASGNVGVGVTPSPNSPTGCLDLADGRIISFDANANFATNAYYNAGWKYKNTAVATNYSQTLGEHHYFTAASGTAGNAISFTEIMTLNASGNLGIGITSPVGRLSVKSTYVSDSTTQQRFEDNTGSALSFGGTAGGVKWLNVADVGTPSTGYPLAFQTGGTERARFNSTGALVFAGGTTTANGIGITFPATQSASTDANTLDDYEEGTYTPTPTNITVVSGTPVYTGKYTKIGNIVQVFFEMSGGNITVTGGSSNLSLPFTAPTVDGTGGYTNGATGAFVGGVLAYGTVMILTTGVTSTSLTGSLVYRVA